MRKFREDLVAAIPDCWMRSTTKELYKSCCYQAVLFAINTITIMQNNNVAGNQEFNSEWTTSEMTLSAFVAQHGECKPKQVATTDGGIRHSIDAADGTSALFSNKLESLLDEAKASGKKFQLDQSKLKIRGYHNLDTNATGFMAYYNSKADSEDFAL